MILYSVPSYNLIILCYSEAFMIALWQPLLLFHKVDLLSAKKVVYMPIDGIEHCMLGKLRRTSNG